MTLVQIILVKFKPTAGKEAIRRFCENMLALKDDAIDPTTHKPYIMSAKGGREDTINMFKIATGFNHVFILEFANEEDRISLVETSEAYKAFTVKTRELIDDVKLIMFTSGKF